MRIRVLYNVIIAAAVFGAGCSGSSGHSQSTGKAPDHNSADMAFAVNMLPHHQQGLDLAGLVPDHSTDAAVIKLAAHISASQAPQIATLKGLILSWSAEADSDAPGHAKTATTGMVDQATLTKVASLQGGEFDRLWLHSMIGHHRGAVEMAQAEIDNGRNADAVTIAHNIVKTQQAEIDQMTNMLEGR